MKRKQIKILASVILLCSLFAGFTSCSNHPEVTKEVELLKEDLPLDYEDFHFVSIEMGKINASSIPWDGDDVVQIQIEVSEEDYEELQKDSHNFKYTAYYVIQSCKYFKNLVKKCGDEGIDIQLNVYNEENRDVVLTCSISWADLQNLPDKTLSLLIDGVNKEFQKEENKEFECDMKLTDKALELTYTMDLDDSQFDELKDEDDDEFTKILLMSMFGDNDIIYNCLLDAKKGICFIFHQKSGDKEVKYELSYKDIKKYLKSMKEEAKEEE